MQSVLFDYGGTLDSDGSTWLERFYPIYKECGVVVARDRFDRAFYDSDDNLPKKHRLAGLDLRQTLLLQVRDVLDAVAPERSDLTDRIAGRFAEDSRRQFARLTPVLERLSRRYRLGVVSNFYGNLDGILRAEGLRSHFAVVADSGVLGVEKPDPEIFLHAARALGSSPAQCVMVGDSVPRDMKGAAAAGMKKALVTVKPQAPDAGQDWTVRSVVDLEAALT
ncbi:MAG: HAD family hydrolase [Elusimicrobia bacterium]|nr:HAD family hydrolase [Elusimicrobiota bacterium]MDE2510476.1 HAD family hydrolase [Elusimicrobiota bacterium]